MSMLKRVIAPLLCAIIVSAFCIGLTGCGKDIAAKWNKGEITEEEVTNGVANMRAYYDAADDAAWAKLVAERTYDEQTKNLTATQKAIENITPKQEEQKDATGTIEELREYVIKQLIRNKIMTEEIKSRNIDVSDSDVDAYVEQQKKYIESRYMEGVFESVLQRQGYANLQEFKDEVREQLKQSKLASEVSVVTADDGSKSTDLNGFAAWLDEMYANANVVINPIPAEITYAVVETASTDANASEETSQGQQEGQTEQEQ